jgi:hypothetical protein
MRFASQIAAAALAVKDAIAAGATKAQVASLNARLARDRVEGNKIERELGRSIIHGFGSLSHLIGEVQTSGAGGKMLGKLASASDVRSALGTLDQQLHQAGLPTSFIKGLAGENKAILGIVASRNVAGRHLAVANAALGAAEKKLHGDQRAFAGAVTGSFDITSAGTDANGRVSQAGIVAGANQAVTRAKVFYAGMKHLIGMKIFPNRYLRSLLGEGPTAAGVATVQALAHMPMSDLKQLAADNRELSKLGNQLGGLGAGRLDQPGVNAAQQRVDHYEKIEANRQKELVGAVKGLAGDIVDELHRRGLTAKLDIDKGKLALAVATGQNQNAARTRSTPPRPGRRP